MVVWCPFFSKIKLIFLTWRAFTSSSQMISHANSFWNELPRDKVLNECQMHIASAVKAICIGIFECLIRYVHFTLWLAFVEGQIDCHLHAMDWCWCIPYFLLLGLIKRVFRLMHTTHHIDRVYPFPCRLFKKSHFNETLDPVIGWIINFQFYNGILIVKYLWSSVVISGAEIHSKSQCFWN